MTESYLLYSVIPIHQVTALYNDDTLTVVVPLKHVHVRVHVRASNSMLVMRPRSNSMTRLIAK